MTIYEKMNGYRYVAKDGSWVDFIYLYDVYFNLQYNDGKVSTEVTADFLLGIIKNCDINYYNVLRESYPEEFI